MDHTLVTLLVGVGMFFLGFFTHTWLSRRPESVPAQRYSRWACPGCGKVKELPADLDSRVVVCNNCQVRLVRE